MGLVPVVDIAPFSMGREGAAQVAREIGHACEHVGFFLISGHGVPDSIIDGCWRVAHAFFDQPLDARMTVAMPYTGYPYGYARCCRRRCRNRAAKTRRPI